MHAHSNLGRCAKETGLFEMTQSNASLKSLHVPPPQNTNHVSIAHFEKDQGVHTDASSLVSGAHSIPF